MSKSYGNISKARKTVMSEGEQAMRLERLLAERELVRVELDCGHSTTAHPMSSLFDFPEDGAFCPSCDTSRQLDPTWWLTNVANASA